MQILESLRFIGKCRFLFLRSLHNPSLYLQLGDNMNAAQIASGQSSALLNVKYDADTLPKTTGVYVTVHGHFYQPPRENPYLDAIERQGSAYPYHDWNERINYECYRPNVFARIVSEQGEVLGIVNNFEYLSFNVGATLMSWLERHDPEVYEGIVEADRSSGERLGGHGNAIAQVYNHIIMPLANERDKYTQIRWGKADFRSHFGRDPEGMWLAETAVDYPTLKALIDEGIQFIILAPSQAESCRPLPTEEESDPEWLEVGGGQIDPTRPYRCFIEDGRHIDIFFYDGPISNDMGFDDVLLTSAYNFCGRLGQAVRGDHRPTQLICVATDGETFGHHKGGTEKCLAYCFQTEFAQRGWIPTNFAHYLALHPPTWEVVLKPITAWSCSHGVDRWQEDCGCGGGGEWHQKWRKPLREALNWLRDELRSIYEAKGMDFFHDPWLTRDDYIEVIRDRTPDAVMNFLYRHQQHPLSANEQVDALRLLEMARHSLLMFTSCGWFFEEISRPEGVQILRYAARAIELAGEVAGVQLEPEFRQKLASAPSNVESFRNGQVIYDQLVVPVRIPFEQVAAHYAITSLFTTYQPQDTVYCYRATQLDYQRQQMGALTLAVGYLNLSSKITWESSEFTFAVLHLGGWDFHCCIQPFTGRLAYHKIKAKLFEALTHASVAKMMVAMTQVFGDQSFDLENLFAEERQWIIRQITEQTRTSLDQIYSQVYRDNYSILRAFHREELPVPQELQVAAEISLSHRALVGIRRLTQVVSDPPLIDNSLSELEAIATEAENMRCLLNIPEVKPTLEGLCLDLLIRLLAECPSDALVEECDRLERLIHVTEQMKLGLSFERVQERYFSYLHHRIVPQCVKADGSIDQNSKPLHPAQVAALLRLGKCLGVDVKPWLPQDGVGMLRP
ncbi:DUF3536 domain-containing protein [Spirulina subsalsa]|uniref:DUF3536 domain-containing protein n=1 Tax=Spirulina subsalsa TaxID=54311 RepID=UPI0002E0FC99